MASLRQMALLVNRRASTRFVKATTTQAKATKFKNPQAVLRRLRSQVQNKLANLGLKLGDVGQLVQKIEERKERGQLDEKAAQAEEVRAKVAETLFTTLAIFFSKAEDPVSMGFVAVGVDILNAHLDRGLIQEGLYPQNETDRQITVDSRIAEAATVYRSVLEALSNVNSELGVTIPEFPGSKLVH